MVKSCDYFIAFILDKLFYICLITWTPFKSLLNLAGTEELTALEHLE